MATSREIRLALEEERRLKESLLLDPHPGRILRVTATEAFRYFNWPLKPPYTYDEKNLLLSWASVG